MQETSSQARLVTDSSRTTGGCLTWSDTVGEGRLRGPNAGRAAPIDHDTFMMNQPSGLDLGQTNQKKLRLIKFSKQSYNGLAIVQALSSIISWVQCTWVTGSSLRSLCQKCLTNGKRMKCSLIWRLY